MVVDRAEEDIGWAGKVEAEEGIVVLEEDKERDIPVV